MTLFYIHLKNFIDDTTQPWASICVSILHTNEDVNDVFDISLVVISS